jgi:hypothetical protein
VIGFHTASPGMLSKTESIISMDRLSQYGTETAAQESSLFDNQFLPDIWDVFQCNSTFSLDPQLPMIGFLLLPCRASLNRPSTASSSRNSSVKAHTVRRLGERYLGLKGVFMTLNRGQAEITAALNRINRDIFGSEESSGNQEPFRCKQAYCYAD